MKANGEAFFSERSQTYMLAGVLFERRGEGGVCDGAGPDLTEELMRVLTAL